MLGEEPTKRGIFPATSWSLLEKLGSPNEADRAKALTELMNRYIPPLRTFLIRFLGVPAEKTDDLLQGFVTDVVIERRLFVRASRDAAARFRTLIISSLRRYLIDLWRRERRNADGPLVSLDEAGADAFRDGSCSPSNAVDVDWARFVIAEALERMEAECESSGRQSLCSLFQYRVVFPCLRGDAPMPYAELVSRFGFPSPDEAYDALTTAKRMFERMLRAVVAEYAGDENVESELHDLWRVLSTHGSRSARKGATEAQP